MTAYTEQGATKQAVIEVNKPLRLEDWVIYQYSYDDSREILRHIVLSWCVIHGSRWFTGIFMLLAGAVFLFVAGPKKR